MIAAIHARLNTKAVDRHSKHKPRLGGLGQGVEVLPTLTQKSDLQSPDRVQLFRRPELEQGQAGFTQTAPILLRGLCTHRLPGGHLEAPALGRGGRTVERQGTIGAVCFHGLSVTLFHGLAKDEEG
jgi:hypothetical protein